MGAINICFLLNGFDDSVNLSQALLSRQTGDFLELEHSYQSLYKQIAAFLYSQPGLPLSLSFPGGLVEWFAKYHKEYILLVSEMSGRKQVEFLGGAFHNPMLPALLPIDRVGQIEQFTTILRQYTGKRPRGMVLPNNAWDASLVSSLRACGMEYVIADEALIPEDRLRFLPCIVQEQGKNIFVLAENKVFVPSSDCVPGDYLARLADKVAASCAMAESPLVCFSFTAEQLCRLIASGWMSEFMEALSEKYNGWQFELNTPSKYIKSVHHFQRTYLSSGILVPETGKIQNIYDYLLNSSATYLLYSKMMYVSLLVNQSRGDKSRKNTTRDLVWQAQNATAYNGSQDDTGDSRRLGAYRSLIQAERTVREYTDFFESVTTFDYDSDGIQEYICQFDCFNAYIQARGGCVFELDVMKTAHNYAGYTPDCMGLFLDYVSEDEAGIDSKAFSRQIYREVGFDGKRHEIKLLATGSLGDLCQPLILRKNYLVNSTGIQVQYIIKNDSPFPLRQFFSVRSSLSLDGTGNAALKAEVISGEQKDLFVATGNICDTAFSDVSLVRISNGDITFVFEMNENAAVLFRNNKHGYLETVISWYMDIPADREIEKTISFSVISKGTARNHRKKASG